MISEKIAGYVVTTAFFISFVCCKNDGGKAAGVRKVFVQQAAS